jgi:hypothetical protein
MSWLHQVVVCIALGLSPLALANDAAAEAPADLWSALLDLRGQRVTLILKGGATLDGDVVRVSSSVVELRGVRDGLSALVRVDDVSAVLSRPRKGPPPKP